MDYPTPTPPPPAPIQETVRAIIARALPGGGPGVNVSTAHTPDEVWVCCVNMSLLRTAAKLSAARDALTAVGFQVTPTYVTDRGWTWIASLTVAQPPPSA